jgi:hypothetical protein
MLTREGHIRYQVPIQRPDDVSEGIQGGEMNPPLDHRPLEIVRLRDFDTGMFLGGCFLNLSCAFRQKISTNRNGKEIFLEKNKFRKRRKKGYE